LNSFTTKLLSSAGEGASMSSGGEILSSSQKTPIRQSFPAPKSQLTAPTPRQALAWTFAPITERLLLWRNRRLKPKTAFSLLARS
jgi:hypothetical protein